MEGALKITPSYPFDMTQVPDECIIKDLENDDIEQTNGICKPHPNLVALARVRDSCV